MFKSILKFGEQTNAQRGCVSVWPGAPLVRPSHLPSSPRWRLRGDTRCVGVATKSPGCNHQTLAGETADDEFFVSIQYTTRRHSSRHSERVCNTGGSATPRTLPPAETQLLFPTSTQAGSVP